MLRLLPSMKSRGADTRAINPEMLVLARQSRALLRRDVSQASGVPHARIRLMERGHAKPTPDELHALAEALGYPVAFFTRSQTFNPATIHTYRMPTFEEELARIDALDGTLTGASADTRQAAKSPSSLR